MGRHTSLVCSVLRQFVLSRGYPRTMKPLAAPRPSS
jgi:hypothetical protein